MTPRAAKAARISRREDRPKVEIERAIRPPGVLAGVERRLLDCDHAVEPCPGRREGEGRRQDADHGRDGEGLGPHAEKRRREVRHPERHDGQEAEEEKVGERVLAESVGELLQLRPGLADEDIADRGAGNEEDQHRSERCRNRRDRAAEEPSEQESAENRQEHRAGDGERDGDDVDRRIGDDRHRPVVVDEGLKLVAVGDDRLEAEDPVGARREDDDHRAAERRERQVSRPGASLVLFGMVRCRHARLAPPGRAM